MRARTAVPPAAIVSLDLRTHRQQTYPINDLQGLSPNGRRIAFVTRRGNEEFQLRASALDGSANRVLLRSPFPGYLAWPRWSPNGREIAFLGPYGLSLIPAGGGTPRTLSTDADAAAWAPDSRRLAFPGELEPSGSARLVVQNEDGSGRSVLGERRPIYSLSWAANGKRLLYSTDAPWEKERDTGRIHAVDAAKSADWFSLEVSTLPGRTTGSSSRSSGASRGV